MESVKIINFLIGYLIAINLVGFLIMYIDKKSSIKHKWRIKEQTLLLVTLLGGSVGTIVAMNKFNHKTKKNKFKYGFSIILIIQIICIVYIVFKYIF